MPAINFQKQFVDKIISGEKRQTIRKKRKNPIKVGDSLTLFYGQRTKHCKEILKTTCKEILDIEIMYPGNVWINDKLLSEKDDFAKQDGFKDFNEMFDWFYNRYGAVFIGQIIKW
jgi:hypothetical protein